MRVKPIRIGISTRVVHPTGYDEPRDALAHDWAVFLHAALPEAIWMPLPNLGAEAIRAYCKAWGINRFILSGGEDVGVSSRRDETERALLHLASAAQYPLLAICRGMQLISLEAGLLLEAVQHHVATRHALTGVIEKEVNSFHHYALRQCPPGFSELARSADGVLEAIAHKDLPWEAWMWHPEREKITHPDDKDRLRNLFL